jgi:hypothetical protein
MGVQTSHAGWRKSPRSKSAQSPVPRRQHLRETTERDSNLARRFHHNALIAQARLDPPAVVLLTGEADMARYAPAIVDYVHTEFERAANLQQYVIYLPRRTHPPEGQ